MLNLTIRKAKYEWKLSRVLWEIKYDDIKDKENEEVDTGSHLSMEDTSFAVTRSVCSLICGKCTCLLICTYTPIEKSKWPIRITRMTAYAPCGWYCDLLLKDMHDAYDAKLVPYLSPLENLLARVFELLTV